MNTIFVKRNILTFLDGFKQIFVSLRSGSLKDSNQEHCSYEINLLMSYYGLFFLALSYDNEVKVHWLLNNDIII